MYLLISLGSGFLAINVDESFTLETTTSSNGE